jgi:hypothetical protein
MSLVLIIIETSAAVISLAKDGPRVIAERVPQLIAFGRLVVDFLLKRKALAMLGLLVLASLSIGTYYISEGTAHAGFGAGVIYDSSDSSAAQTANSARAATPSTAAAPDRPVVVCVPPFTIDAGSPGTAPSPLGRDAARRIYQLIHDRDTTDLTLVNDDDLALALDRIERDNTGLYDERTQLRIGNLLNATRLVVGEIASLDVRTNVANLGGREVRTRIADVTITLAVLDPETLRRTALRTLSGRATVLVNNDSQSRADVELAKDAVAKAVSRLADDAAFLDAVAAPAANPAQDQTPASEHVPPAPRTE